MRKYNYIYIFVILLLFLTVTLEVAWAEDLFTQPLRGEAGYTWRDCIKEALKNHPDLISAAEKVKQARSDKDIDLSSMLPQITSEAGVKKSKTGGKKTTETYSLGLTGRQLVFDGFKTASEVSNASKTILAQGYNYTVISSNIRLALRRAFVGLLKAQELIFLTEDIAERRRQNFALIKLRYEAGREHKGSLLTAEADLARAEFEIGQAQRSISLAQRELSKELGSSKKKLIKAKGEFSIKENYGYKPDFEHLADTTPFLKELIAKKEAARYNLQSEQADFLPQVYLNASIGETGSKWIPRKDEWSTGVTVSLPWFEGGSRIAEIYKAKSQLNQAKADERSGRDYVLVTLETTWKDLQDAIMNLLVEEKFLKAAEARAKIASVQYEKGLVSFDDWVIIEDNLVDAKKSYLNAQAEMLVTKAYWIQAKGGTLDYE